jgi:exodeoxyribonuclease V alpha subunit
VHGEAARLDTGEETRRQLLALNGSTLHRLLGWRPDSHSRFRHHRGNPLPHDVVVVDEASMVSLSLMAKLVESVRVDARLILVGDPDQLASVEAGAVLGDVIGPAARQLCLRPAWRRELATVTTMPAEPGTATTAEASVGDGIVVLRTVHRYGGAIADLATAIQCGDDDGAMAVLRSDATDVEWIEGDLAEPRAVAQLESVRHRVVAAGRDVHTAAETGDARGALEHLAAMRVLCAHRRGPYGVTTWMGHVERWLARSIDGYGVGRWYVGRPLLVTENDYGLGLYNGDTGVVVEHRPGEVTAAFDRRGDLLEVRPSRLGALETVHAMTVHKSQGSQFATVAVILPDETSPILSRELLYTAITRAQRQLVLVGTEASVRAAVSRPLVRSSGLRERLWSAPDP